MDNIKDIHNNILEAQNKYMRDFLVNKDGVDPVFLNAKLDRIADFVRERATFETLKS